MVIKKFAGADVEIEKGYIVAQDPTCGVRCDCISEEELWVSDYEIVRCDNCGKGYRTEFVVWQFDKDEENGEEKE